MYPEKKGQSTFSPPDDDTMRWPAAPLAPTVPAATMGYKGIPTSYLPTTTVTIKNNPDTNETNYH